MQKIKRRVSVTACLIIGSLWTGSGFAENPKDIIQNEIKDAIESSSRLNDEINRQEITVDTYIQHGEMIEALDMQSEELEKRKVILQKKIDLLNLLDKQEGSGERSIPVFKASASNEARLKAEIEKLKDKVDTKAEEVKRDPIEYVRIKDIYINDGVPEALTESLNEINVVNVGGYLYSWRVVDISQKGVVIEKNGYRRNIGINSGM